MSSGRTWDIQMSTLQIELDDRQKSALDSVAAARGMTSQQVIQEAITQLLIDVDVDEQQKFEAWREAAKRVAGIWADRNDLPDFAELRKSWDRGYGNRE